MLCWWDEKILKFPENFEHGNIYMSSAENQKGWKYEILRLIKL